MGISASVTANESWREAQKHVLAAVDKVPDLMVLYTNEQRLHIVHAAIRMLYYTKIDTQNWHWFGALGCLEIAMRIPGIIKFKPEELFPLLHDEMEKYRASNEITR